MRPPRFSILGYNGWCLCANAIHIVPSGGPQGIRYIDKWYRAISIATCTPSAFQSPFHFRKGVETVRRRTAAGGGSACATVSEWDLKAHIIVTTSDDHIKARRKLERLNQVTERAGGC